MLLLAALLPRLMSAFVTPVFAADTPAKVETVDIGVIKNSDMSVVQRRLYSKSGKLEVGVAVGALPFDGFTFAPKAQLTGTLFLSEKFGIEAHVGGGYGMKTARYTYLESPAYGVAVEAYRYLADLQVDAHFSPIYAKMNFGKKIVHNDWYGLLGAGATLEQSVLPAGSIAIAPGIGFGIGTQVWVGKNLAVRAELRDDVMIEARKQSGTAGVKQNVGLMIGLGFFTGGKK
jgi:outer membrane beta-barrel protein